MSQPSEKSRVSKATVRIIAGQWRGRRLPVLDADGLRPTKDAVRETAFNWLAPDLHGAKCLDLFAGTGAMGLECASRYARQVTLVEKAPKVAKHLQSVVNSLPNADGVDVIQQCALTFLHCHPNIHADIIFIDPPFEHVDINDVLDALFALELNDEAQVYIEQDAQCGLPELPDGWHYRREKRSGQVVYGVACKL